MSNFKFNFVVEDDKKALTEESQHVSAGVEWLKSEEVSPLSQLQTVDSVVQRAHMFTCKDLEIGHVIPSEVLKNCVQSDNITRAEEQHSDLIIGKYEGGLKIWECTTDLIEYLLESIDKHAWEDTSVLDLGCGAGLLGILALVSGASVVFQDYNKEVLESVTIPNVLINFEEEERLGALKRCKFFSGDWASFDEILESSVQFDYILTSETIYNTDNYDKIVKLLKRTLKKTGTTFIAAKTYYFGVGGGTRQFEAKIQEAELKSEVCWKSSGGIQREIIKVTIV